MKIKIVLGLLIVLILAGCSSDNFTRKEFCNLEGFEHTGNIYSHESSISSRFYCYNGDPPNKIDKIYFEHELSKWEYFSKNIKDCTKCEKTIQED